MALSCLFGGLLSPGRGKRAPTQQPHLPLTLHVMQDGVLDFVFFGAYVYTFSLVVYAQCNGTIVSF